VNLQQLEYILAVDQLKSFSKAADYCHVTQATLSAMVKKLEEQLDIVIFDRKANPIATTENGRAILIQAQQVVSHANALVSSSKSINQKIEGRVKLGIIPTIASSMLPLIMKQLVDKYPLLHVEIHEITTNQLIKDLREGKLDVGILSTPIASSDLETKLLYVEELQLYGYLPNNQKAISKSELNKQRMLLLQEGHCLRDQVIQLCELKKQKALPVNLSVESNTFETLLNLVDVFQGITVLPSLYVGQLGDKRKQNLLQLEDGNLSREVSICFYRPHAKWNIINRLQTEIIEIVQYHLM
jgi:LysR family hydrogen peroxide-inducible transcriptional activator